MKITILISLALTLNSISPTNSIQNSEINVLDYEKEESENDIAFDITDRFFATTYTTPGNKTNHILYRFSNDSWDKGNTWFRMYYWSKDADQYDSDRDFWAIGWWNLQNGQLEITQYNEFNKVESKPHKAIVEGLDLRMKELGVGAKGSVTDAKKVDYLYKMHELSSPPSWVPQKVLDRMLNRFPPN